VNQRNVPPYRDIADQLRRRITTGELAPGDRVPSTREITRQWGVAMATATKALTALRHDGLVQAVPGVGTVVAGGGTAKGASQPMPRRNETTRRTDQPEQAVTSARIIAAAIDIADAEGLAGVSMRRVAADVGVATMSLYRHVADKDDLLLQMMDTAFAAWPFPDDPPEGWRNRLELASRMLWAMFRRHPWLAPAMSVTRPQPLANAIPFTEWVLAALAGCRLDPQTIFTSYLSLINYIRGTAINVELEAEAEAQSGLDSEEWMDAQGPALQEIILGGRFPQLARLTESGYDFNLDDLFEFGLQRLLDGISVLIEGRMATRSAGTPLACDADR
jgi:AcrR family transcriptional regulator